MMQSVYMNAKFKEMSGELNLVATQLAYHETETKKCLSGMSLNDRITVCRKGFATERCSKSKVSRI